MIPMGIYGERINTTYHNDTHYLVLGMVNKIC